MKETASPGDVDAPCCARRGPGRARQIEALVVEAPSTGELEKVTETWVTIPERPVSMTNRNACLVHIYPTGPGMGSRYTLAENPVVLGRGGDAEIRINDHSVSRR